MPTVATLLSELESSDDERARAALRDVANLLRGRGTGAEDRAALGERIVPLVERRSPKVRQAAAEIADLLPEPFCDRILAALVTDRDPYVRRAAERASARRRKRQSVQARENEQDRVLGEILGRIESRSGRPTRRLAERAARLAQDSFVRKLQHELGKVMMPLEYRLSRIEAGLAGAPIDVASIRHDVGEAKEMVGFARSVLKAAAACSESIEPTFRTECIAALVDEARAQLADRLGARAERLAFVNDVDPKLRIEVDRHTLLQAFQNILQNAAEAHHADAPRLEILVASAPTKQAGEVALTFTDKGRGMTEDQIARAFIPFGSNKPGGTGVGMVVSRRMVEEVHGGTLSVKSAPGEGTTVTIALPIGESGGRR